MQSCFEINFERYNSLIKYYTNKINESFCDIGKLSFQEIKNYSNYYYNKTIKILIISALFFLYYCNISNAIIICAVSPNNKPYSYVENGELKGISVEIAKLVQEEINYPVKLKPSYSECIAGDILISSAKTDCAIITLEEKNNIKPETLEDLTFSDEIVDGLYIAMKNSIFIKIFALPRLRSIKKKNDLAKMVEKYKINFKDEKDEKEKSAK